MDLVFVGWLDGWILVFVGWTKVINVNENERKKRQLEAKKHVR